MEYEIKDIPWLVITLGLGVLVLSIISTVMQDVKEDSISTNLTQIRNESFDFINNSYIQLANARISPNSQVVTYNLTTADAFILPTSNYTMDFVGGRIIITNLSTSPIFLNNSMNISYSFITDIYKASTNVTSKGAVGAQKFAGWFITLGLIAGLIIVLGIIYQFLVPLTKR